MDVPAGSNKTMSSKIIINIENNHGGRGRIQHSGVSCSVCFPSKADYGKSNFSEDCTFDMDAATGSKIFPQHRFHDVVVSPEYLI